MRELPHDNEAEAYVLGAVMLSPRVVPMVFSKLRSEDFFFENHATIFRAATRLFEQGKPIDTVLVGAELEKEKGVQADRLYLVELTGNLPSTANAEHYAQVVRDLSAKRALIHAGERTIALASDISIETAVVFDRAQEAIFNIWRDRSSVKSKHMADALRETWEKIANLSGKPSGIPTGFYDLDRILGGLHGGDVILIAARPGIGKTAFVLNISAHVAKLVAVGFISLEMSVEQLTTRFISGRTGIDHMRVQSGDLNDAEWDKVSRAVAEMGALPIVIDDVSRISTVELRARARRLKMTEAIGLLIVDYLQLMDASQKHDSRVQEVTEISRSLKSLAKELDVPVIACAQLNRQVEQRTDRRPVLSDLRESGALEQDADAVLFLYRPGLYDNKAGNDAEVIVAKHRNGPTGSVKLLFRPEIVRFLNATRPAAQATP